MTPLQKIAMGLVVVLVPANFPRDPHPEWRFYDALPDPLGWLLVLAGVWALTRASDLDLDMVRWLGVVAFVVSVPLWFPQVSHLLVPEHNPDITVSFQWFVALPQTLFLLGTKFLTVTCNVEHVHRLVSFGIDEDDLNVEAFR